MKDSDKKRNEELDFEIDLSDHKTEEHIIDNPDREVFVEISQASSRFILDYSRSDTSQELAGVLLGHYTEKDAQYRVVVEAAIEARYTEASKGSVTFTHRSWEYINKVKEERYPEHSIVGWFHTHPGFGIFLSGYDKFIHQNFFNLPWQVAYVVDPLAGKHGFFGWANNNLEKIPFNAEIGLEPRVPEEVPEQQKERKAVPILKSAAVAAIVLLFISNAYLFIRYQEANRTIDETKSALSGFEQGYNDMQSENMALVRDNENLTEKVEELSALAQNEPVEQTYIVHTIEAGDSLWSISDQYLGDGRIYNVLAELNNIEDPDNIEVGNKLLIPPAEKNEE